MAEASNSNSVGVSQDLESDMSFGSNSQVDEEIQELSEEISDNGNVRRIIFFSKIKDDLIVFKG